jgi:hypothetical protein
MNSDSRWYGKYRISRTKYDASKWGIWYDEMLLCDGYGSAEEAALAANKKDFDSEDAVRICAGSYSPSDINMWRTIQPQVPSVVRQGTPKSSCTSRDRTVNSTRLDYD